MRRFFLPSIALCILASLLAWPPLTGVAAIQVPGEGPACDTVGTPVATPVATPMTTEAGPAGVFQSDAREIELEHGRALLWRSGERSVFLLHGAAYDAASWEAEAQAMASQGFTVLAMEELSPDAVGDGIAYLMDACGASGVVMIGASAGGGPALEVLAEDPEGISGLILLSATGDAGALGEYPKLFVASEGEGLAEQLVAMADGAPGDQNETVVLPGSAHAQAIFESDQGDVLVDAILAFLSETADWGE